MGHHYQFWCNLNVNIIELEKKHKILPASLHNDYNYLYFLSGNLKVKVSTMSACNERKEVLEDLLHSC